MTRRLYLPSTGAAPISPAFGAWGQSTSADRLAAVATKIASAAASKTTAVSSTVQNILNRQYVYGPLAAGSISGTVKGQLRGSESNAAMDGTPALHIRVVKPDGTDRGTLLAITASALTVANEYGTTLANRNTLASTALSAVTALAGDYLVIEIGCRQNAASANRTVAQSFGDAAGVDLAEDQTTTTANDPWIEFSGTVDPATHTPSLDAFRFADDGIETHALALANDGLLHAPPGGEVGSSVSTPDSVAASITGNLDVRILLTLPTLTPAAAGYVAGKEAVGAGTMGWGLYWNTGGTVTLAWSSDGSNYAGATASSVAVPATAGVRFWLRWTLTVNNGSGQSEVRYYLGVADTTTAEPAAWTQIGATLTYGFTTAIFDNAKALTIAGDANGNNPLALRCYRMLLYTGATLKADFHPNLSGTAAGTSFVSATGETWTLNGTAWRGAQSANITESVAGTRAVLLRVRATETGGASGLATDDWQLYFQKNGAGGWVPVTPSSAGVRAKDSATLTDQAATTNKLGLPSGAAFVAGLISEDGTADNKQLTALNASEFLFALQLVAASVAPADTYDFALARNAALIGQTVTPRLTIGAVTSSATQFRPLGMLGTRTGTRQISTP